MIPGGKCNEAHTAEVGMITGRDLVRNRTPLSALHRIPYYSLYDQIYYIYPKHQAVGTLVANGDRRRKS